MPRSMRIVCALAALAAAAVLPGAGSEALDRKKLDPLHRAGQAFAEALGQADTPLSTLKDLRQKLEIEAEKVEGRVGGREEKYIYDLYSTAAAEYAACLARYEAHGSIERLRSEVQPVEGYLRTADRVYRGAESEPAPRPATPPPAAAAPAPAPPPTPPSPDADAPPPPAAPAQTPSPRPAEPSPRTAEPPPPARSAILPPAVEMTPDEFRKRADRVRIAKAPEAVRGCTSVAEVSIPGKSRQGVYEVGGRNFFYEDSLGLARLKTVEAGGDTFLVQSRSKAGLIGEAYRCGN